MRFPRHIGPNTCLRVMAKNLSFSRFKVVFMSYSPQFWGLGRFPWLIGPYTCLSIKEENLSFHIVGPFSWAIPKLLGFWCDSQGILDPIHVFESWPITCRFLVLRSFLWVIAHSFGVLGRFPRHIGPDTYLRVMAENLSFSRFRAVLMSYSPQFWDFGAILKTYWTR